MKQDSNNLTEHYRGSPVQKYQITLQSLACAEGFSFGKIWPILMLNFRWLCVEMHIASQLGFDEFQSGQHLAQCNRKTEQIL